MKMLTKKIVILLAVFSLIACYDDVVKDLATPTIPTTPTPPIPVLDTVPPVITLNGASTISINIGDTFVDQGATAVDGVDGVVAVSTSGSVSTARAGTYQIIYSAMDNAGNSASAIRRVVVSRVGVVNTVPPVITLNGASTISINIGDTFVDQGATAVDDVDGVVAVSTSGSVNTARAGTYQITYSATDNAGNSASAVRTVNVNAVADTVPPVITLNGPSTIRIDVGDPFTDSGASAVDDVDGFISVEKSGYVDTAIAGVYTITYSAMDNAGNSASVTLTVHVNTVLRLDQTIDIGADVVKVFGDAGFTRPIQNLGLGTGAISCSSSDETIATTIPNNANGDSCQITLIRGRSAKYSFDNTITINVEKSSDTLYNTAVDSFQLTVQGVIHDFTGLNIRDGECARFDTTLGRMVMTTDGVGVLDLNHEGGKFNIQPGNTNVNHFCVAVENNYVALVSMGPAPVWFTDFTGNEWRYAARYKVNSNDRRVIEVIGFHNDPTDLSRSLGVSEVIWSSQTGNGFGPSNGGSPYTVSEQLVDYTFPANNEFAIFTGIIINDCNEQTKTDENAFSAITTQCSVNGIETIVDHQTRF